MNTLKMSWKSIMEKTCLGRGSFFLFFDKDLNFESAKKSIFFPKIPFLVLIGQNYQYQGLSKQKKK